MWAWSERTTLRVVGWCFVVATVASLAGSAVEGSILDGRDYLLGLASHDGRLVAAALLYVVAASSATATAVLLFPVLRRHRESAAVGYVTMRIVENVLYVLGAVAMLAMLTVSRSDAPDAVASGDVLAALHQWSVSVGTLVFSGLGACVLDTALLRSRLVPRWLAGWGLVGAVLLVAYGVIGVLGGDTSMGSGLMALAMPIAVQEMVFAGWLIVKGMRTDAPASGAAERRAGVPVGV